jgi:hypothetical protein
MVIEEVGSYRCVNSTIDLFPFVDEEERDGQNNSNYKNFSFDWRHVNFVSIAILYSFGECR